MLPLPCAEPFNDSPLPSRSSKSLPNAHMPTRRFGWCGLAPSFPLPPRCVTSCALGAGTPWPPFRALNWRGPACHWASRQPLLHMWRILLVPPHIHLPPIFPVLLRSPWEASCLEICSPSAHGRIFTEGCRLTAPSPVL